MVDRFRSRTASNRVAALLAASRLDLTAASRRSGIAPAILAALVADERTMPDARTLLGLCIGLGQPPHAIVAFDPAVEEAGALLDPAAVPLEVAVVGAGNLGHVFAGTLAARSDVRVRVLVSNDIRRREIERGLDRNDGIAVRHDSVIVRGRPALVTAEPAAAITAARIVLMCLPTAHEGSALRRILPYLEDRAMVGAVPAPGGYQWMAANVLRTVRPRATIFGLAAIPWMCKVREQGVLVDVLGAKALNGYVALAGGPLQSVVGDILAHLTRMPTVDFGNFLQITLNPGNQLFHPGILYAMERACDGRPYDTPPLFYESLSEDAAGVLDGLSDDVMAIRRRIEIAAPTIDLSAVLPIALSIQAAYAGLIADPRTLRSTIATNRAYAGIVTPMVRAGAGYRPDPAHRFFTEDVPFGLVVLKGLAELGDVATPTLDSVLAWAQRYMGRRYLVDGRLEGPDVATSGAPQRYAIVSLADAIASSR